MKRKKYNAAITALSVLVTVFAAVCVALVLSKTGVLPSVLGKEKTTESSADVSQNTESTDEVSTGDSTSESSEPTENTSESVSDSTSESVSDSTSESTAQSPSQTKKEVMKTTATLNVRTGPGTNYDKVGLIPSGTNVTRISEENGWSRIEYNGSERYVSSSYLIKADSQSASETQSSTNISQVQRKVVNPGAGNWNLVIVNADIEYDRSYSPKLKEVCPGMGYNMYMDERAADHYTEMYNAAKKDGITLTPISGYRSYELQERNWKARIQNEQANGYSYNEAVARASEVILPPGTSEHNLGIAMDICSLYNSFADTKEYAWLVQHAEDYGFILRYKAEWKSKTGIVPEPWHWRYVGVEYAKKINQSGLCLEDYVAKYGTN